MSTMAQDDLAAIAAQFRAYVNEQEQANYKPVPVVDSIPVVECSSLQSVPFTILKIDTEDTPNDQYHFFRWLLTVRTERDGKICQFKMNPSKKRNDTMGNLQQVLPKQCMTLLKKDFIEQRNMKLIVYYDLSNYTEPASGTITH